MCNYGKEFVRRLEMKWVDLVHLMLYNLTVYNAKKYYDLDTVIVPYANDNWLTLQLPPRVRLFNIIVSIPSTKQKVRIFNITYNNILRVYTFRLNKPVLKYAEHQYCKCW